MDAESPDTFVEFAWNNPVLTENKIITFLSSERARADRGENIVFLLNELGSMNA